MADNTSLGAAKSAKNDEFYTQYSDIEAEMNAYVEYDPDVFRGKTILLPCDDPEWSNFTKYFAANFERFGLKKLISTSYAKGAGNKQLTLFEESSPLYDAEKHETRGKLFTLTHDKDGSGNIDTDDIEFSGYLEGDGDFRSTEVCTLRDEADIIITNPPFSMFHHFISWLTSANKQFIIIGNVNEIKYVEVFPLIKQNKLWLGTTHPKKFRVPERINSKGAFHENGIKYQEFGNVCWFTNVDHGISEYPYYSNYNALEIPLVPCIPVDYKGIMGVPISLLDKYNPDQFELLGMSGDLEWAISECSFFNPPSTDIQKQCKKKNKTWRVQKVYTNNENGLPLIPIYDRLFIRQKEGAKLT